MKKQNSLLQFSLSQNGKSLLRKILASIIFLICWHFLSVNNVKFLLNFGNLPAPEVVLVEIFKVVRTGEILDAILASMERVYTGAAIALILAVTLGMAAGMNKTIADFLFPITEMLRPIPNIAWAPISIVLFPTIQQSIIFITFIGAFFPVLLNTTSGVRSIPKKYLYVAKTFRLSPAQTFFKIIFPHTLPYIFTGAKIGIGVSWLGVIVAEMIAGQDGIGYYTWLGYQLVNYTQIIVGIIFIGILGVFSTQLIQLLENYALRWRKKVDAYV